MKYPPTKQDLNNLYNKKDLSVIEISKIYHKSGRTIRRFLKEYNFPNKDRKSKTKCTICKKVIYRKPNQIKKHKNHGFLRGE